MFRVARLGVIKFVDLRQRSERVAVAGMKGRERGGGDALGLTFEAFGNQTFNAAGIEVKHTRDQAKCENIFALILGRAADGFHGKLGNRTANMAEFFL